MSDVVKLDSELALCSRLLRSLAHRVRGDLSVIANDLAYLGTIVGTDEIRRSRERCDKIADALSAIGDLQSGLEKEFLTIRALVATFGVNTNADIPENEKLHAAPKLLTRCVAILVQLIGPFTEVRLEDETAGKKKIVALSAYPRALSPPRAVYSSFSSFAGEQLGERFVVEASIVDLILRDHGWEVQVFCNEGSVDCSLKIPIVIM
jgi:hypothetical protein